MELHRYGKYRFFSSLHIFRRFGRDRLTLFDHELDVIPLPHPSGLSTWVKTQPGKSLTKKALRLVGKHEAFRSLLI